MCIRDRALEVGYALRTGSQHYFRPGRLHFIDSLQAQSPTVLVAGHHAGDAAAQRILAVVLHLDKADPVDRLYQVPGLVVQVHLSSEAAWIVVGDGDIVLNHQVHVETLLD